MGVLSNRLLIVDNEAGVRDMLSTVAENLGFEVYASSYTHDFAEVVQKFKPTALILDLSIPGSDRIELLRDLAKEKSEAQVLVISDAGTRALDPAEHLWSSQRLHMAGTLQKPFLLSDLEVALKGMMGKTVSEATL